MTKYELRTKTEAAILKTQQALQTVYDALNSGQKKQILKDEKVAELFERYKVNI